MTERYHIFHETRYGYDKHVTLSQQILHMQPRSFDKQQCLQHRLQITPTPGDVMTHVDYHGNPCHYVAVFNAHDTLNVVSESLVETQARPTLTQLVPSHDWQEVQQAFKQNSPAMLTAQAFRFASPNTPFSQTLLAYAQPSFTAHKPLLEAALNLSQRIFNEFEFDPHATDVSTPLQEVLKGRRGVCQDFAHLMIACLRMLGLSCRYVSGYILTTPPAGKPRMIGADASHAWVSVFCPQNGWVDIDPTNNCLVNQEHITVAWGRDFSDVSPMRGIALGGGKQHLEVKVTVLPTSGSPQDQLMAQQQVYGQSEG